MSCATCDNSRALRIDDCHGESHYQTLFKRRSDGHLAASQMHSFRSVRSWAAAAFDPQRRPWIDLAPATSEQIVAQEPRSPSGALSIERPTAPTEIA